MFRGKTVVIRALPNGQGYSRLGLSVGSKVGSAIKRNRVKRLLREAYRLNRDKLTVPCDLVIVPRPGFPDGSLREMEPDVISLLRKIDADLAGQ